MTLRMSRPHGGLSANEKEEQIALNDYYVYLQMGNMGITIGEGKT